MKKSKHEFMICTTRKSSTVPVLVVTVCWFIFLLLVAKAAGWLD